LFSAVVVVLAMMAPTPPRPRAHRTSVKTDLTEGFRYIGRTPDVRLLALVFVAVVLSGFSYQTIMPGYLEHALGHPASHLGLLFGAAAVGGIIVTLVLAARRVHNATPVMLAFGGSLAAALMLLAIAPGFGAALVIVMLVGASSSGFQMLNNVNLMERTDPIYFGRVMSVSMMAFGVQSVFAYPVGACADLIGERATLAGLGCICLTAVVLGVIAMRAGSKRRPAVAVSTERSVPSRRS
jgi:hypothetical protein